MFKKQISQIPKTITSILRNNDGLKKDANMCNKTNGYKKQSIEHYSNAFTPLIKDSGKSYIEKLHYICTITRVYCYFNCIDN